MSMKSQWTVLRYGGRIGNPERVMYSGEDGTSAQQTYEYAARMMRRGWVRLYVNGTRCAEVVA